MSMLLIRRPKRALASLIAMMALGVGSAQADLLEMHFADPTGQQRTLLPTAGYSNATGAIDFYLGAGVDRRVRVAILNKNGGVIQTATSPILGANDRITTEDGRTFYGAVLSLPAPNADGEYTLRSEILTSSNAVVEQETFPMVFHRKAPTVGTVSYDVERVRSYQGKRVLGGSNFISIQLNGVESDIEIEETSLTAIRFANNSIYKSPILGESNGNNSIFFNPKLIFNESLNDEFDLVFKVKDKAGNETILKEGIYYHNRALAEGFEAIAIYDPVRFGDQLYMDRNNLKGYGEFNSGDEVFINPSKFLLRIKKENFHTNSPYGFGYQYGSYGTNNIRISTKSHEDDKYIYYISENITLSSLGKIGVRVYSYGLLRAGRYYSYNLVFNDENHLSPSYDGILSYMTNEDEDYTNISETADFKNIENKSHVKKIRVNVQPRGYVQTVRFRHQVDHSVLSTDLYTIPPNESSIEIDVSDKHLDGYRTLYLTDLMSDDYNSFHKSLTFYHDFFNPVVKDKVIDEKNKEFLVYTYESAENEVKDFGASRHERFHVSSEKSFARIKDKSDKWYDLPLKREMVHNHWNRDFIYDLSGLPDGRYEEIEAHVVDAFNNETVETLSGPFVLDSVGPSVTILSAGEIGSLDDITLRVSDEYDADPKVVSIELKGGPASDQVQLVTRTVKRNEYKLEYPIMFPSLESGEEYTLTVVAEDASGNRSETSRIFTYSPDLVVLLNSEDGQIHIPAVSHEFLRTDKSPAIRSEQVRLADGSVIRGAYDVQATLSSDSEQPIRINGREVRAGETVTIAPNYDFNAKDGRFEFSIEAVNEGEGGHVGLLISTTAPNSPVAVTDLNLWVPQAQLESPTWQYRQVIDPLDIVAQPAQGSVCALTIDESAARRADPFKTPLCLLEWESTPDESVPSTATANGMRVVGLRGQAVALGNQPIRYSLYMFTGSGDKIKVGEGEQSIEVVSALGAVTVNADLPTEAVTRRIDEVTIRPRQQDGPAGHLTMEKEQAIRDGSRSGTMPTYWFEWVELPEGFTQDTYSSFPLARGMFQEVATHPVSWRLSVFSRSGEQIVLSEHVEEVVAVNPPMPDIQLSSQFIFNEEEKILIVPLNEPQLGETTIEGKRALIDVNITRDAESLYSETISAGYGYSGNIINRRLASPVGSSLWDTTQYDVKASYTEIPEVELTQSYTVYSSPITGAKPFITSPDEFALNTESLPIHVDILDQYAHREPYNPDTMGEWRTRVLRVMPSGELETVSDLLPMSNGHAEFEVDISEIADVRTLRFTAESELVHPIEGYSRVEQSPRVLFLSLLRGEGIDAAITTRTVSGPAPLRGSFKVDLADRTMMSSTGDIVWERSTDGGATWEQHVPDERYKFIYHETFETGTYHLRALITNKNSGAQAYTEQIEVIAYDKPELQIEGPTIRFVGDEVTLTAHAGYEAINQGERTFTTISEDDLIFEWSIDGGRTYDHVGKTLTLSSDAQKRVMVAARVRTELAPSEDKYAYNVKKTSIEFKPIRAPRVRVTGPSLVEVGKEYEFNAVTSLPYRGMGDAILGYFTLPNGDQVHGEVLTYSPTDEDLAGGRMAIRYDAWVEGYEDQGTDATHTLRSSIWKYIWPEFGIHYQANASFAPALVTMTLRPMQAVGNRLEEPKYEWTLPEQIEMVDSSRDITRKFRVLEPGDHKVSVRITDARGNEAEVDYPILLEQAVPFVLDLELSPSNKEFREPLSLVVRPRVSGGHPRDRFESFEFTVDGESVESLNRYAKIDLEKGVYDIGVIMVSQMGVETETSAKLEVFENQVPICTVSQRESKTAFVYTADCTDPDGRLRSYDWQLGDRELVSGSRSITVGKHRLEGVSAITLVGIDDSDGRSEPVVIPVSVVEELPSSEEGAE